MSSSRRTLAQAALLVSVIGLAVTTASVTRYDPEPALVPLGEQAANRLDGAGLTLGGNRSALQVIIVSDYECTACAALERAVGPELRDWANRGRIRYRLVQAPLRAHRRARKASEALYCAAEAGATWTMHEALSEGRVSWGWGPDPARSFLGYAESMGLDVERFEACLDTDAVRSRVESDLEATAAIGIGAVPVILVGSTLVRPSRSFQEVLEYVERRLDAAS